MNNQTLQFSKKQIFTIVLFVCLLVCLFFFFTNSILIVKSSHDKTVDVKISRINSEEPISSFELNLGSKFMILPKGDYTINAREKNKQTTYTKNLRGFSYNTVRLSLSPQKQSSLLGVSSLGCAIDHPKTNQSVFYRCDQNTPSQNLLEIVKEGQPPTTVTMSSMSDSVESIYSGNIDQGESLGSSIKPYLGGFLYAVAGGGTITFHKLDSTGNKIGNPVTVSNFKSILDDSSFATSNNNSDKSFSVLDRDREKVLIFNDLNKAISKEVDVSSSIHSDNDSIVNNLYHSPEYVYLSSLKNPTLLEYHDDEGKSVNEIREETDKAAQQQSIVAMGINKIPELESVKIPDNLTVRELSVSNSGDLLLIPQRDSESKELLIINGKNTKKLNFAVNEIQDVCWVNNNLIYSTQSSDNTSSIFSLDTTENISQLLYENYSSAITGLFCNNNALVFSVRSNDDGLLGEATYYSLVDKSESSIQLSTILPLYIDLPEYQTLLKIEQYRTGVKASLIVEPENEPSHQYIEQKVHQELSLRGISEKNIPIQIDL